MKSCLKQAFETQEVGIKEITLGSKKLIMHSVPFGETNFPSLNEEPFFTSNKKYKNSVVFTQVNSMHYLNRVRYLGESIAESGYEGVKSIYKHEVESPLPKNLDEITADITVVEMANATKTNDKSLIDRLVQNPSTPSEVVENFENLVKSVYKHILGKEPMRYFYNGKVVLDALFKSSCLVLGDIPESLIRIVVANTQSLEALEKIAFESVKAAKDMTPEDFAYLEYPEVFASPRISYMGMLLHKLVEESETVLAFLGKGEAQIIEELWEELILPWPHGFQVPASNEDPETLIRKHALLEAFMETKVWGAKFTRNPFAYLKKKEDFSKEESTACKKTFYKYFSHYQGSFTQTN